MSKILPSDNTLSEADVLSNFKRGWDAFKNIALKKSVPPANNTTTQSQPVQEPQRVKPDDLDDENALVTIGTELLRVDRSEVRVVLYLEHLELKNYYLVKGGGGRLVDALDDAEVDSIKHGGTTKLFKLAILGNSFTYSKLLNAPSGMDRAVLINAPSSLIDSLMKTSTADEARPLLKKLFSHNLYLMTLNLKKAKQPELIAQLSAKTPAAERAEFFNPHILENYPNYVRYMSAIGEYAKRQKESSPESKEEKRIADLERKADLSAREKNARGIMQGSVSNSQFVTDILVGAQTAEKAATALLSAVSLKKLSRIDLDRILLTLKTDSPLLKAQEVLDEVRKKTAEA